MKAKNNKTGEIVTNFGFSKEFGTVSYIDSKGALTFNTPNSGEWTIIDEGKSDFDWQSFRAEAAKDILSNALIPYALKEFSKETINIDYWTDSAIEWTDSLISKLKEKEA